MSDIAKAASGTTEPESVSQPVQHPPPSVESLDAALTAARRIGGQQSHVTKLLQHLRKLLVEKGEASEVLGLQSRVKEAHRKCLDAVQEFCGSLDRDSEQYKRYMDQLQVRDREIQEMDRLVNVYILKELNMGSSRSSKSSRSSRSKSNRNAGKASTHTSTTLSDAARVHMDIKLAEINLAKVKRNEALKAEAAALAEQRPFWKPKPTWPWLGSGQKQSRACWTWNPFQSMRRCLNMSLVYLRLRA